METAIYYMGCIAAYYIAVSLWAIVWEFILTNSNSLYLVYKTKLQNKISDLDADFIRRTEKKGFVPVQSVSLGVRKGITTTVSVDSNEGGNLIVDKLEFNAETGMCIMTAEGKQYLFTDSNVLVW